MSNDPKTPLSHDGSGFITLETEPLVFFHPTLVGLAAPGKVQPVRATLLLEEEPVTWPQLDQLA
jgi:hypothetical protein